MNLFMSGSFIGELLSQLVLWLSQAILFFVGVLYRVFEKVANVNLFGEEVFREITSRLYVVIGIAMLFIFAYNIVLLILNPNDKKTTGGMGKIVKEVIISLVTIVLLPTIFNWLYIFQANVLESNVIGQIILNPTAPEEDCNSFLSMDKLKEYNTAEATGGIVGFFENKKAFDTADVTEKLKNACNEYAELTDAQKGAYSIAPTILSTFMAPVNYTYADCVNYIENNDTSVISDEEEQKICVNYYADTTYSMYKGNISAYATDGYLMYLVGKADPKMNFLWLGIIVAGCLAVWMFLCYTIEIGVRVAKLGFYQIISPIPVMMRVIPGQKEKFFDKWFKDLINVYLDVFIRLVIIYFVLFAVSLVPDVVETLFASMTAGNDHWLIKGLCIIVVILGILKFAQDFPNIMKEFFGSGNGSFSFRSPSKQLSENKLGGAALGMAGAGAASAAGNLLKGFKNVGSNLKDGNFKGAAKSLAKTPFSIANGTLGAAVRGAKTSYGASGFKDLGNKIAEAKYATDAAQERGFWGSIKHRAKKIGEGFQDFGQFITGGGATNFRLQAIDAGLGSIQAINANFENATIKSIESSTGKMWDDYRLGKDLNFNGKDYKKEGNYWVNKNDSSDRIAHDDKVNKDNNMGKLIKNYFDELKKAEYVKQFEENNKAFERLTNKMISTLNENFPKIGTDILEGINKKLDGKFHFNDVDELTDKIGELMKEGNKAAIYDINDALEKNLKAAKKEVIVAQQEKKDK